MGGKKKKYIDMFGSFTEPFNYMLQLLDRNRPIFSYITAT